MLSSAYDTTVRQWDARTGEPIGEAFTAHKGAVYRATSLPDKKFAASITKNGELLLWRRDTLEVIREAHVLVDSFFAVAFSPDGTRLLSVHWHMLRLYDVENCRLISEVDLEPCNPPLLFSAVFSPDASKVFFASGSQCVLIWDVGKEEFEDEVIALDYDEMLVEAACTPDGTLVASSTCHKTYVWSTITRRLVTILDDNGPFAFSSDSQCLTYVLHDTELSVNPLKIVETRSVDSLSVLDHPAIEYSTTSQDANRLSDPTYAESDSVSDFFASPPPNPRRADSPVPHPDSRPRESRYFSRIFKRSKRSQIMQVEEQSTLGLAFPARDRNPLVVASYEVSRRTRKQQSLDMTRGPSRTETSSADSKDTKSDGGGNLGFGCFAALRSRFHTGSITREDAHSNTT